MKHQLLDLPNQTPPLPNEQTKSLLESLLVGKSEAVKRQIWEIVSKTKVASDDPLFLVLIAIGTIEASMVEIPKALKRREDNLSRLAEVLESQNESLIEEADRIASVSNTLERKLKAQVPRISKRSTATVKELLTIALIAFIGGLVFGQPLLKIGMSKLCQQTSSLCQQQEVKP